MKQRIYISEQVGIICKATRTIRDIFPSDLPHLWNQLAPFIEQVEESALAIRRITKQDIPS